MLATKFGIFCQLCSTTKSQSGGDYSTGSLTLKTVQDTTSSSDKSSGGNVGINFGAGGVSGGNIGANQSKGSSESNTTTQQSGIIYYGEDHSLTAKDTISDGGMIAKIDTDADGNQSNGTVNFTTDTLVTHDLINTATNDQRNIGGNLSGGKGENGASINNASIQAGHTGQEYQSITKATVGEGAIVTSDIASGQDSLAGVNRDALNTETVTKDMQTGGLDLNATVDTRVFTDAGRTAIIGEQKDLAKHTKKVVAITAVDGLRVPAALSAIKDKGNKTPDGQAKSTLDKIKDNNTVLSNVVNTGMGDDTKGLVAAEELIKEGELTNDIYNQIVLDELSSSFATGTDAEQANVHLVDDLTDSRSGAEGTVVLGSANETTAKDIYLDKGALDRSDGVTIANGDIADIKDASSTIAVLGEEITHINGQGEEAASEMGNLADKAYNVGKWANSGDIADTKAKVDVTAINTANTAKEQQEMLADNKQKLEDQQDDGDAFEDDTDVWTYNGNSAASTNTEMRALNSEAKRLFPNSTADQEAYKAGKRSAFGSSVVNAGKELVEIARDPKSAITNSFRGMINVLTNPNKAGREMRSAIIQWKNDYNKALKNNPKLAGKMRGELEDAVGFGVASTVITGGSANALKALQKTGRFETRGVLGDNVGSVKAKEVVHGGNGQAISGHGYYDFKMTANKELIVPEGTTVIAAPFNTKISDTTGRFMESVNADKLGRVNAYQRVQMAKDWAKKNNITGQALTRLKTEVKELQVYKSGSTMPHYSVSPPERLTIHKNSTTVGVTTNLEEILKPNKGCIPLATCTETIIR